jgi:hypothetical protein
MSESDACYPGEDSYTLSSEEVTKDKRIKEDQQ